MASTGQSNQSRAEGCVSEAAATVKPMVTPEVAPIDEWTARILRNMKRMATDEAYRRSIAKDLS